MRCIICGECGGNYLMHMVRLFPVDRRVKVRCICGQEFMGLFQRAGCAKHLEDLDGASLKHHMALIAAGAEFRSRTW